MYTKQYFPQKKPQKTPKNSQKRKKNTIFFSNIRPPAHKGPWAVFLLPLFSTHKKGGSFFDIFDPPHPPTHPTSLKGCKKWV